MLFLHLESALNLKKQVELMKTRSYMTRDDTGSGFHRRCEASSYMHEMTQSKYSRRVSSRYINFKFIAIENAVAIEKLMQ
jgi:hypothetical protein